MKRLNELWDVRRCDRLMLFLQFLICLIFFTSCDSGTKPFSIVEFTGNAEVYNLSRSLYPILHKADSVNSTALLAGNGDLIMYGEKNLIRFKESGQNKYSVETSKEMGFVNGKINSISIPGNDNMLPWFRKIKTTDLSALDFIFLDSIVTESYIPLLTELAGIKPNLGLGYGGDLKDIARLLKIFKPAFIVGGDLSQKDFDLLSGLNDLEILSLNFNDPAYTIPLPAMPHLKQLIMSGVKKEAVIDPDFLINNRQLEKLTVAESGRFNFAILKPLDNLKGLIIDGSDTIENFDLIKNHKNLELLTIGGKNISKDSILRGLANIRWMTFYENITQNGFNSFIEEHPGLEVVVILNNDTITSLKPLLKLRKLYGLTISDTLTDVETVKNLKNLKYLSLPLKVLKDTIKRAEWQKSLPGARIVANEGFCLGSGWLLLIIPLTIAFVAFRWHKLH